LPLPRIRHRDNGKKIKGRKRHIATDTLGLLLAVLVTAASVQDNAGGQALIGALATAHPAVARAWVDAGYQRAVADEGARHGIDVRVYTKQPGLKGFHATPRWPVERTFGWLMLHRRACPRLRDPPRTLHHHDPLVHDRQHEQAADRRIHLNLANRNRHTGRTSRSLDETPS
jgi:transposase